MLTAYSSESPFLKSIAKLVLNRTVGIFKVAIGQKFQKIEHVHEEIKAKNIPKVTFFKIRA